MLLCSSRLSMLPVRALTLDSSKIPHFGPIRPEASDIRHLWGQYSPAFDQQSSVPVEYPSDCEVTFLQILSRHGSRYPTRHKSIRYKTMLERVLPLVPEHALVGPYKFLANYSYDLGNDTLTILGRLEMAHLAFEMYNRYAALIVDNGTAEPFVRASGSQRVIDSAETFAQGLNLLKLEDPSSPTEPDLFASIPVLVLSEAEGFNNTLDRNTCANVKKAPYSTIGSFAKDDFASKFILPIADRLNSELCLDNDTRITREETISFMDLCAFETVALLHPFPSSNRTADGSGVSPFCNMFTDADFRVYDYLQSLGKYYGYGHGNPLGPSIGVGFVNELIARLTAKPVHDRTSTNRTLDTDPKTFPIGEVRNGKHAHVFADFSHDNTIMTIHAALRLFEDTPLLPTSEILNREDMAGWSAASAVPFGSHTVIEKLRCKGRAEEDVRILVNSDVMPLKSCGGDKYGRCSLSKFIDSLTFARSGGRWDLCFDT